MSKKTDYGLLIVSKLRNETDFVPLAKLVEDTKLPLRFLARISAVLANQKVLVSREGRVGGYKLGKRFYEMNIFDFLSIFEKNLVLTSCQRKSYRCRFEEICKHKDRVENKLQEVIYADLKRVKLQDLFS